MKIRNLTQQYLLIWLLSCFIIPIVMISNSPDPFCLTKTLYKQFPLTIGQILYTDADNFFSGYNLNITIASNTSFASMSKKLEIEDRVYKYIPNVITTKMNWGSQAAILYKSFNLISLNYGRFTADVHKLPQLQYTVPISNDPNIDCFDVVMLYDYGLAIVDCVQKVGTTFTSLINYFYYIDLTNHTIIRRVANEMFVAFRSITKRSIVSFREPNTGQHYFLRAYLADGVDYAHSQNTYMEMWSMTDPYDLQLLRVVDRTFLYQKILSIYQFKVYLGDIFMLDIYSGFYRLDILGNQQIAVTGRYIKEGFTRFSVYSDDLEDELIFVLANNHSIYEIDWHQVTNPVLITKYSLMEQSKVRTIRLSDKFVIVQSSAYAKNSTNDKFEVDYTWIFTKGSRTYSHAHQVVDHNSSNVLINFNPINNKIIFTDETGLYQAQVDEARIVFHQINQQAIGTQHDVVLYANSWDYHSNSSITCQHTFKVVIVKDSDMRLWQTGLNPATNVSFNYPGVVHIPLTPYALGPLIEYKIFNPRGQQVPQYWIDKVNQSQILIDKPAIISDITFFYTEVVVERDEDIIIYYYEDTSNTTHVAQCKQKWETTLINCTVKAQYSHNSRLSHFTTAYFRDRLGPQYYYILTLQGDPRRVTIFDFERHLRIAQIVFPGDLEGFIGGLASSNGYLYVLLPYIKTINVYKLSRCQQDGTCALEFSLNAQTLKPLGVDYFSPQHITTDKLHPQVLFIKCLGSLLIIDIDNKQNLIKLDEIASDATKDRFFKVAVNGYRMTLVAQPNIIEEYDLALIYTKNFVVLLKKVPIYGYKIQPNADIQFSDFNSMVFINAVDPSVNKSVILIYRTGRPAAMMLYKVITLPSLYSRPGFEVQVSGFFVDYLSIIAGGQFYVYRVFQQPLLSIKDSFFDFTFEIGYANPTTTFNSSQVTVSIVNYPQDFDESVEFNDTMQHVRLKAVGSYTWHDRRWWVGHVVNYNYTCPECSDLDGASRKVRVREHVDAYNKLRIGGYDYIETWTGGISVWNDLFRWRYNGSIREVVNLPDQKTLEYCTKVTSTYDDLYVVTACEDLTRGVNLYATSFASFKAFTWGPYRSSAYQVRKMQLVNDLLMVVDASAFPEYRSQQGGVYIFQLSPDAVTGEQFDELQVLDSNDFFAAHGWTQDVAIIGNAHMIYSTNTKSYRVYITQIDHGFFVVDFTHVVYSGEINVVSTYYVDLKDLLIQNNLHLPNDATFQAVTFIGSKYNPHFDTENILITTKGYHNFEVTTVWDDGGHLISTILHRVYYRYGYYDTYNQVKSVNGYVAIGYILPPIFAYLTNYTRQYTAVYDSSDYQHESEKGYSERYILGTYPINHTAGAMFAFNTTYDIHSNGTRLGIVITEPSTNYMNHASISKNLSIELKEDFKDQTITIIPYNDFHVKSFKIELINPHDDDITVEEEILIIVIVSICVGLTIFFIIYVVYLQRKKQKQSQNSQQRVSLLTQEESIIGGRQSLANQNTNNVRVTQEQPLREEQSSSSSSDSEDNKQQTNQLPKQKQIVEAPIVNNIQNTSEIIQDKKQQKVEEVLVQEKKQQQKIQPVVQPQQKQEQGQNKSDKVQGQ